MKNRMALGWTMGGVAVALVIACSSSNSSNGGGGGGSGNSCIESLTSTNGTTSSACSSCESSKCSSEENGVLSGCADLLSCVCPGGTYNASLIGSCAAKAEEQSCATASSTMQQCSQNSCASECSGGSTSSSSSGGASSSSGSSSGSTSFSYCTTSAGNCFVVGNGDSYAVCAIGGGTTSSSCPTANLVGCCLYNSPNDWECYYSGTQASDCPSGDWTTTLP